MKNKDLDTASEYLAAWNGKSITDKRAWLLAAVDVVNRVELLIGYQDLLSYERAKEQEKRACEHNWLVLVVGYPILPESRRPTLLYCSKCLEKTNY